MLVCGHLQKYTLWSILCAEGLFKHYVYACMNYFAMVIIINKVLVSVDKQLTYKTKRF